MKTSVHPLTSLQSLSYELIMWDLQIICTEALNLKTQMYLLLKTAFCNPHVRKSPKYKLKMTLFYFSQGEKSVGAHLHTTALLPHRLLYI